MNESRKSSDNSRNGRKTGERGEEAACRFLESEGYTIRQRNYRAGHDEIDIIAENEQYIVFVEVKTRTSDWGGRYGRPSAAVGAKKRQCLARAAQTYIGQSDSQKFYRFDVVEVTVSRVDGSCRFNHMKGVFGAEGKIWV